MLFTYTAPADWLRVFRWSITTPLREGGTFCRASPTLSVHSLIAFSLHSQDYRDDELNGHAPDSDSRYTNGTRGPAGPPRGEFPVEPKSQRNARTWNFVFPPIE